MSTPVFCCGAECTTLRLIGGTDRGEHMAETSSGTAACTVDTGTVRTGTFSYKCSAVAGGGVAVIAPNVGLSSLRVVSRFYVNFSVLPDRDIFIAYHSASSGPAIVFDQSEAKLYACVGSVGTETRGSTGAAVTAGVWYLIDADFNVVAAANDTCDVKVDGTALGQATAAGGGVAGTINIGIAHLSVGTLFVDDVLISHTAADYPFGGGTVSAFVPTSDGTHNVAGTADFRRTLTATDILNATTTAFQLVDAVNSAGAVIGSGGECINMLAPVNATDYVECVFGPASGSAPTAAPRAVETFAQIAQAGTGAGNMEIRINDNGTQDAMYSATAVAGIVSDYRYKRKHYALAPTGGAWTVAAGAGNFNNLKVRFGSPALLDVNPDQYFCAMFIEAEFATVVAPIRRLAYIVPPQAAIPRGSSW